MINFAVGPVQSFKTTLKIGSHQVPYFRNEAFSKIMLENEKLFLEFVNAPSDSRAVFITGSGTASMEAAVVNLLNECDNVLVVNGGSFGKRFVEILRFHHIKFDEILVKPGDKLTNNDLLKFDPKKYTAFLVNLHETSVGTLYDIDIISSFCKKNNMLLIVDAVSAFLVDEVDMKKFSIDVVITGSQKALACYPGVSITALSPRALQKMNKTHNFTSYYLDYSSALINGERGQTPFTPAVSVLIQINDRLNRIRKNGGVNSEINRTKNNALYFRNKVKMYDLPIDLFSTSPSNGVSCYKTRHVDAYEIFVVLQNEYNIWICPNGGDFKHSLFRIGHLGNLTKRDYDKLLKALVDLKKRGILL